MNQQEYSENARADWRGLLVILLVRLRQTPWDENKLNCPAHFFMRVCELIRYNGVTRKAVK